MSRTRSHGPAVVLGLVLGAGCVPHDDAGSGSTNRLRVVFVVWPGREASDAMEREVLVDARVQSRLNRLTCQRVEHDSAPATIAALVAGVGTIVFHGDEAIARRPGVASVRSLLSFLDDALQAARERDAVAAGRGDEALRVKIRTDLRLGFAERAMSELSRLEAPTTADAVVAVDVHLTLGDVAAARALLDRLDQELVPLELRARVALAERRDAEVVDLVNASGSPSAAARLALARALLERGDREAAQELLRELAAGVGGVAVAAEECLVESLGPGAAHAHR